MKFKFSLLALATLAMPAMAITPNGDGVYEISNAQELEEFAAVVNGGATTVSAVLTADIDMDGVSHTPIGNSKEVVFKGSWDGGFHTISSLNMENPSGSNLALFGYVGVGAKISNTIIDALSTFHGEDKCAAFVSQCSDSEEGFAEFSCLGTEASVHAYSEDVSKGRAAALVGPSNGNVGYKFYNCYNLGEVRGVTVGGLSCYAPTAYASGCFTVVDVKVQKTEEAKSSNPKPVGSILIAGVTNPVEEWGFNAFFGSGNAFYPEVSGSAKSFKTPFAFQIGPDMVYGAYKVKEEDWAPTGALCWYLNNGKDDDNVVWGQNLDEAEPYPTFIAGKKIVTRSGDAFEFTNSDKVTSQKPTSGVENITGENNALCRGIFNIQGMKVKEITVPGLYIIDGKKVLVK